MDILGEDRAMTRARTLHAAASAAAILGGTILLALATAGCGQSEEKIWSVNGKPVTFAEWREDYLHPKPVEPPLSANLMDLASRVVNAEVDARVAAWNNEGGVASMQWLNGVLIVSQTPAGHERMAEFLSLLNRTGSVKVDLKSVFDKAGEPEDVARVRAALAEEVGEAIPAGTPLVAALRRINASKPVLNIVIAPAVESSGQPLGVVSAGVSDVHTPIAAVLEAILPAEAAYKVGPGYVLVCTREQMQQHMPIGLYAVRQREGKPLEASDADRVTLDELKDILENLVNDQSDFQVAAWDDQGGAATINVSIEDLILVEQTRQGQAKVASLLARLAEKGAITKVETFATPEPKAVAAVRERLAERIDLAADKMPIEKVLAEIGKGKPGLAIRLDPLVVMSGTFPDLPEQLVTMHLKQLPRSAVLDLIMGPGLTYRIDPDGITILPKESERRFFTLVAYKVTLPAKPQK
jgi:hypothetical protein